MRYRNTVLIGRVVVPSDVDREDYVKYSLSNHTVCVLTEKGDFLKNCPVLYSFCGLNDGFFNSLEYPKKTGELGSQVVCLNIFEHDIPIVIGCLITRNNYSQLEEEYQFKFMRTTDEQRVSIEGKGLEGLLRLVTSNGIELKSLNKEGGYISFHTNSIVLKAKNDINLISGKILSILIRNLDVSNAMTKIKYESGVGFEYEDEFTNKIILSDGNGEFEIKVLSFICNEIKLGSSSAVNPLVKGNEVRAMLEVLITSLITVLDVLTAFALAQEVAVAAIPVFSPLMPGWVALKTVFGPLRSTLQTLHSNAGNILSQKVKLDS